MLTADQGRVHSVLVGVQGPRGRRRCKLGAHLCTGPPAHRMRKMFVRAVGGEILPNRDRTLGSLPLTCPVLWGARLIRPCPQPPRNRRVSRRGGLRYRLSVRARRGLDGGQLGRIFNVPVGTVANFIVRRRTWYGRLEA